MENSNPVLILEIKNEKRKIDKFSTRYFEFEMLIKY